MLLRSCHPGAKRVILNVCVCVCVLLGVERIHGGLGRFLFFLQDEWQKNVVTASEVLLLSMPVQQNKKKRKWDQDQKRESLGKKCRELKDGKTNLLKSQETDIKVT